MSEVVLSLFCQKNFWSSESIWWPKIPSKVLIILENHQNPLISKYISENISGMAWCCWAAILIPLLPGIVGKRWSPVGDFFNLDYTTVSYGDKIVFFGPLSSTNSILICLHCSIAWISDTNLKYIWSPLLLLIVSLYTVGLYASSLYPTNYLGWTSVCGDIYQLGGVRNLKVGVCSTFI